MKADDFQLKWPKSEMEESVEDTTGNSNDETNLLKHCSSVSSQDLGRNEEQTQYEPFMETNSDKSVNLNQNNCNGTKRKYNAGSHTELFGRVSRDEDVSKAVRTEKVADEVLPTCTDSVPGDKKLEERKFARHFP